MPYQAPYHHTDEELRRDLILDLESDLNFSLANDQDTPEWVAYREKLRVEITNLREGGMDPRLIER